MTNRWRTQTSKKLFLADIQRKAWQACIESGRVEGNCSGFKPKEESLKQSTILLMLMGWESFLNEIAEYHQQRTPEPILNLQQLLAHVGEESPEIGHLLELSRFEGSWICDFLKVISLIRFPQAKSTSGTELAENALIATSGSVEPVDSIDNISRILDEFKCYLEEVRERMSEW
ncbi:DUF6586 family protein [Alkalimarinus coralli]|uniref:DUF6586 family protein n=1 Tax=Alkalimarinus coralli TaxID=2935863 RepID=UPI00202B23D4|nr:DUF6586 family protein [Alkalimarinus coralli]